jgi:hypothetical protein
MNTLNIQLITFAFGAMLLLIGILGGGFEIKELKIPQVGRVPRFLAALVGALFIIVGAREHHAPYLRTTQISAHAWCE